MFMQSFSEKITAQTATELHTVPHLIIYNLAESVAVACHAHLAASCAAYPRPETARGPAQVREMPLVQFKTQFGGDIKAVLLEDINARLEAARAAAMPPPGKPSL